MGLARTWSVGLTGVQGALVEVEVDLAPGVPTVVLVGLPDAVVRQSVDRVRAAVVNSGHEFPLRRVTIGLSPAAMPKQGSGFDLALAARSARGIGSDWPESVNRLVFLGELLSRRSLSSTVGPRLVVGGGGRDGGPYSRSRPSLEKRSCG